MSDRPPVLDELSEVQPAGPEELDHLETVREFAQRKDAPFDREDTEGHVVASGLVASPELDRIVLLHHEQIGKWLQCGGHAEPGETRARTVAMREAREETGFDEIALHPLWENPIDVDVHQIPATDTMPEHLHLDVRYLLVADPANEPTAPDEEAREVRWFDVQTARRKLDLDGGLHRLLWKVRSFRVDAGYEAETVEPDRSSNPSQ